jgi:glycine/D-amino acid oxidase-like deaminating enzyme
MMFNISAYSRMLLSDFLGFGGKIVIREFHGAPELASLPQPVLVNCTGYGARALFGDGALVPVRGQLARMAPRPDITYGLFYKRTSFIPRRDGLVFQYVGDDDYYGYNDDTTTPDRVEAEQAVTTIASLFQ